MDMSPAHKPFLQLAAFSQKLCSPGTPLSREPPIFTLLLGDLIPEDIMAAEGKEMTILRKYWHHIDQEENILLKRDQETPFSDLLNLLETIGKEARYGEREYYIGTIWEVFCVA